MKLYVKIALATGVLALAAGPTALAAGRSEGAGSQRSSHATPGPRASLPEKARAYGWACRNESRTHVKGERGTPFSQCVTDAARAAVHPNKGVAQLCKNESRKHVKGEKGTPFSRCVRAAAKVRRHERNESS
jgi:hypothetical protein